MPPRSFRQPALSFLAFLLAVNLGVAAETPRIRESLDFGWRFLQADAPGAEKPEFDDSAWRTVELPHDWSIEGGIARTNAMAGPGGFFQAGIGWYRRTFIVPPDWSGKQVLVEFEGVYMNADVWLNGGHLGSHPYGYTSFYYDLAGHLKVGGTNTLVVKVDNSREINTRWYSGSGIYRHVWLTATEPAHIAPWGVYVTTPEVGAGKAKVQVRTLLRNDSDTAQNCRLETSLLDPDGKPAGTDGVSVQIPPHAGTNLAQSLDVDGPKLWSPETPDLYRAVSIVTVNGRTADEVRTSFGIRSIKVSVENGFQLNGQTIKICGGCVHHDNGCLGAAAFDRAEERRVELLKAAGFNAVRCAHNPPSAAFLDACDRLGMMVIDESFDCWVHGKNPYDYSLYFNDWWQRDLDSMVLRDRNHPAIVMWSIGNEVPDRDTPEGAEIGKMLAGYVRSLDDTRFITSAICWANSPHVWSDIDGLFAQLDVGGYNYTLDYARDDHQRVPARVMVSTESYPSATFDYWSRAQDNPYIIGDFVWTALDYLGESGIGRWTLTGESNAGHGRNVLFPWHGAWCGDLDLTGFRKPISHYRNIVWNRGEKLYLSVREPDAEGKRIKVTQWGVWPAWESWTWPGLEGTNLNVEVFSSCDQVRLFLNDQLIGEKPTTRAQQFKAMFSVPYAPGRLRAVGVQGGKNVAEQELATAGDATHISLVPDRDGINADGQDLSYVTVEVRDAAGRLQPNADQTVKFSVTGPGTIAGVDNGDLKNTDPYQGDERKVWHGRAIVVIRSSRAAGQIKLGASSPGLTDGVVTIQSRPVVE